MNIPNERVQGDYCEYFVKTNEDLEKFYIRSQISSRAGFNNIQESYKEAIIDFNLNIVYKIQKANWFVIHENNKKNGNIIYFKKIAGDSFVSILYIEYKKSTKKEIEPFLSKISTSFISQ